MRMQISTRLLPFHVWLLPRIDFHRHSASPSLPTCSLTGFMKDTKRSHHLLYELICYIAPRAFPSLSLFTAVSSPARKGEGYLLAAQMIASTWYPRQGPWVPHIASWNILSSGFRCLPVLLAPGHLPPWWRRSLWVKLNVQKSLCSVSLYLWLPRIFTTLLAIFNFSYMNFNGSQQFHSFSGKISHFLRVDDVNIQTSRFSSWFWLIALWIF